MEFLIDYENLAALLKWTEEEKMEYLGQHVSLSLGRDIMAIVASSGSWKENRNEMMRKYLKAEKMATEAELAAVQRKNYATYNDFLRAFTLLALRIPGVTDRIMSKYFLRQFSEFDKDKILSAYQQTSKFEYTRDVDFSTVTDLAEKTVVTETLALLKEGEVIDLIGKTGDKVKKGIESLHERVHGVDSKMDRMENALLVMQAQVSRPALPPQEAVVPVAVAIRRFGRRDPTNEQCKYCTMIGHFVRVCPRLNHDIERQRCKIDGTLSKLLGTMVSVSFQTMLQASPRLLKGLGQLLRRKRVEVEEAPKLQEQDTEEAEATQGVSNLQSIPEGLGDLEKAFADIRLSLPDREGGEVMRAPPRTKLSFHALLVGKLKVQIGTHHTDALVDGGAEITLIRRDFATVTRCTVNKEVAGSIWGVGGEIPFTGKPNKTLRQIQDLQKLNAVTIRDAGSLSQADLLAESHAGRSIYSLVDLYSGYDQLPFDARDRLYTAMHTPAGQLQMQVTSMGFTNAVAEAQRRMLAVAGDMFSEKCEPYIDDNPVKGARYKDEAEVQPGVRKFVWDHLQDIKDLPQRFLVYNITASGPKNILAVPETYLFGRRFILRIDPTNVAGALKNYKPIDPTVGRWIGFIWKFDYKVERIVGLRNRADGLSRVCITPEGIEDKEPIDAFLEYEGGTLVVDNEMADPTITTGQLLIQTLEKGGPPVVAELREGPATTVRRKEEKDSWGAEVGAREELMAMVVEGGRDAVMMLAETWAQKECQYVVNLTREEQATDQNKHEFFLIQMSEGVFKKIGLLLVGNKQSTKVSPKAREEVEKPEEGHSSRQAEESSSRKKKLYVGFDHNLVVSRGGRNQGTRGTSPLREGEPIVLPSKSDTSSEEERNPGKRPRLEEDVPVEFIDLTSDEEEDEVTTPTREERGRGEHPGEKNDKWIEEFGPEFNDWFDQWGTILRFQWIMKAREKLGRGEDLSPTTFFTERTLLQFQGIKRQMEQEMEDRARREAQRRPLGR
ncbi:hypothetical protein CBR_g34129 [Chara braunii]|uniref:Reverse transcriptase domain-containing protein n=1 Tax=Chara braunii TaxID=69332 RepID=A0A388LHZ9_CHABU|nr:hypothetical protein CBR_g34129 [Chara braunii]|eukprot:GBG81946.1 hypothetical protein CBR_g34129 [Chara braunii]